MKTKVPALLFLADGVALRRAPIRWTNPGTAADYARKVGRVAILGACPNIWIVTYRDAQRMEAGGYEALS